MTRLLAAAIATAAFLVYPATSGAYTYRWSWGYNYLGNSTNNGLCDDTPVRKPGAVCSPWNYYDTNVLRKNAGGTVAYGWSHPNEARGIVHCCAGSWASVPSMVGFGGYLKSTVWYVEDAASYLQTNADVL